MTEQQAKFFANSKVRDAHGELLPVYHGTGTTIRAFDFQYAGQGNDQYGGGFYFTSDFEMARGYMTDKLTGNDGKPLPKPGGEDDPNVVEAYLNFVNPIIIDGSECSNLDCVDVSAEQAHKILRHLPSLYRQKDDEDVYNPLGDFFEDFWDEGDDMKKEDFLPFINRLAYGYFKDNPLKTLDIFFGTYVKELHEGVREAMGYDGVIVKFKNGINHYVAWFPNQIKRVDNLAPTDSDFIDG